MASNNDTSFHILRLVETAESVSTVYFRPPGVFTNAMLTRPEITALMRDADPSEEALYANASDPKVALNKASADLNAAYSLSTAGPVDVAVICAAIDSVAGLYPVPAGVREKTQRLGARHDFLLASIAKQEDRIERQRQKFAHFSTEPRVDSEAPATARAAQTEIERLKAEILELQK